MPDYGTAGKEVTGYAKITLPFQRSGLMPTFNAETFRVSYHSPLLNPQVGCARTPTLLRSNIDNGTIRYKIVEVCTKMDVGMLMQVRLYNRVTGELVQEKQSQENGVVEFTALNPTIPYTLLALDPTDTYNASVLDLQRPSAS